LPEATIYWKAQRRHFKSQLVIASGLQSSCSWCWCWLDYLSQPTL